MPNTLCGAQCMHRYNIKRNTNIFRISTKYLCTESGFEDFISTSVCRNAANNILNDVPTLTYIISALQVLELTGKYSSLNPQNTISLNVAMRCTLIPVTVFTVVLEQLQFGVGRGVLAR